VSLVTLRRRQPARSCGGMSGGLEQHHRAPPRRGQPVRTYVPCDGKHEKHELSSPEIGRGAGGEVLPPLTRGEGESAQTPGSPPLTIRAFASTEETTLHGETSSGYDEHLNANLNKTDARTRNIPRLARSAFGSSGQAGTGRRRGAGDRRPESRNALSPRCRHSAHPAGQGEAVEPMPPTDRRPRPAHPGPRCGGGPPTPRRPRPSGGRKSVR